jgi:hypothetical protein
VSIRDTENRLFRGAEFRKFLALVALMVIGWPLVIFYAVAQKRSQPPPAPPTASTPLPPPDDRIELRGAQDKTIPNARDNPGYRVLFERTRNTSPAELAAQSRQDVGFAQLIDNPPRYRGLPIHLEGTARRIVIQDHNAPDVVPSGKFYEAWFWTPDSQRYPYTLAFEDAPKDLPTGKDVAVRLTFDGYFFKTILYLDGKGVTRFAPLLIGRVQYEAPALPVNSVAQTGYWAVGAFAVLSVYLLIRIVFTYRRGVSKVRGRASAVSRANDKIDPDALANWIHTGDQSGTAETEHDPHPTPGQSPEHV